MHMHTHSGLTHIILDFDGTCTQIPPIFEKYLDFYRRGLNESGLSVTLSEWRDAQAIVRQRRDGRSQDVRRLRLQREIHTFSLTKRPG
jgi:hypothetical protein